MTEEVNAKVSEAANKIMQEAVEGPTTDEVIEKKSKEQEISDKMAAYNKLLTDALNVCNGHTPEVAVASLVSAAACILVDHTDSPEKAKGYMTMVHNDVMLKFDGAFENKNKVNEMIAAGDGNDAGE